MEDDDDEGDVPPLLGPGAASASVPSRPSAKPPAESPAPASGAAAARPAKPSAAAAPRKASSGGTGLKKGFFGGSSSSSSSKSAGSGGAGGGSGAVPTIRASADPKAKSLELPEVQASMAAEQAEAAKLGGGGSASWMTPDLLQKIASKPVLRKAFTDPRCQAAMSEMQTDPQAAIKKYGEHPEMREFLQEFMKLMGDHFTALGEKQEAERAKAQADAAPQIAPAKSKEVLKAEAAVADAMADPDVVAILQEPKMQAMLQAMSSGQPFELQREARADPTMMPKLRKLKAAGLINIEFR